MSCFSELYIHSKNKLKVELRLPAYATKSGLKNVKSLNTSMFAKKIYVSTIKIYVSTKYLRLTLVFI